MTSVTTNREQPSLSRRSRTDHRSPPSVSQPRPRSRCSPSTTCTSSPTATRSPYSAIARAHHIGFSSAAVPILTRAQPVASAAVSDSSSRIPPDSSTLTSSARTTSASNAALVPRPKAASRSTRWIHSAPSRCQVSAASRAVPYSVSLPALPCTSRTACPSMTSTAGNKISDVSSFTAPQPNWRAVPHRRRRSSPDEIVSRTAHRPRLPRGTARYGLPS